MNKNMNLNTANTVLVIVDLQDKLIKPLDPDWFERVTVQVGLLTLLAGLKNIPVFMTEQYPKGLGTTHEIIIKHLTGISFQKFAKNTFSAASCPDFTRALEPHQGKNIILSGMETHVCVYLTTLGLLERGHAVFVPQDAVIARDTKNHENGLQLIAQAGGVVTNAETLVFQIFKDSTQPGFKEISNYLKNP